MTLLLFGLLWGYCLGTQIKILPYGPVRPTFRVQCLSELPKDVPTDQIGNMTVVWRDMEGQSIGESPISIASDEPSIGAEMTVQYAAASALYSCAFKRPGEAALNGLQFTEIYVYAKSEKCESDLAYCDPSLRACRQAKCVCPQGEHVFDGTQCVRGYKENLPCYAVSPKEPEQCVGSLQKVAVRGQYMRCGPRKSQTILDRLKQLVPTMKPKSDNFTHCPCKGAMYSNIVEIGGVDYCQEVEQATCCVPLSFLADSHDFSLVWFTLISISIFIGLVLIAAFVLMVCKSRQQIQAQHRAQLRVLALQQQEDRFSIYDPRVHRAISMTSDKPPAYHEVVRRESTPPPAYNVAMQTLGSTANCRTEQAASVEPPIQLETQQTGDESPDRK